MTEPDELYTLRAQYWLGHYAMAMEEAKAVVRRPMSPALKLEREEFLLRSQLGLGQYDRVIADAQAAGDSNPAIKALGLAAQFHTATTEEAKSAITDQLKVLSTSSGTPSTQLVAAQVFLEAGMTKEALQCVHLGSTMEHHALCLQVYLKIDRLDLAQKTLRQMKQADEDAVLTQLGGVYCNLSLGSTGAADALHGINAVFEQYGSSPMLFNLRACALIVKGSYAEAEQQLQDCLQEYPSNILPDTLINLIVCSQHQQKPTAPYLTQIKSAFPLHPFCQGVDRVQAAFAREVGKYKV